MHTLKLQNTYKFARNDTMEPDGALVPGVTADGGSLD